MNKRITIDDICKARDTRIIRLNKLLQNNPGGIILFTLNIPGAVKDTLLYRKIFTQGIKALETAFLRAGIIYNIEQILELVTGSEAYFTFMYTSLQDVKKITSFIEENHPLGRIFDIDIFDTNLNQIKSGREIRKCFICNRPAFECSRSRRHSIDELLGEIKIISDEYFDSILWKIAAGITEKDFSRKVDKNQYQKKTNGEKIYIKYGIKGVR